MDLSLAASPVLLALCALAALGLAAWSYRRTTPPLGRGLRALLAALRGAALGLVLFLLFEPVWTRTTERGEPALVALLVDTSESLTLGTGGPTPAERVRAALAGLPADAALRPYLFDGDARPVRALAPESLAFRGDRTDLAAALERVEADFAGRNLRAVVLVSDGRPTEGRNPAAVAERFRVPVFTATAGDSLSARDVRLARAVSNDVALAGSPLPIEAGVRATGFAGQSAAVTVTEGGAVVARATITLPADGAEAAVDLAVTPPAPGLRRYTVTVGPLAGEATTRNNALTVEVRVVSDRRRVLLVAAGPSPDLAALRTALEADRGVELTVRTQRAPGQFYEGPLPDALGRFDGLVLAGYPGAAASDADAARLAAAIGAGLPTVFFLGTQTELGRLGRVFGSVLPVAPEAARGGLVEVALALAPAGEEHPVFADLGVPAARLAALPPVGASPTRWALREGTRVLATARRGGVDTGAPLVAVRQAGAVRSAAVLATGTWRWRALPQDLADLAPVYPGLVAGLVRWTTGTPDRRPVRVRADRALFGERERVTFSGRVVGEGLAPVDDAVVTLAVRGPGGGFRVPMRALGGGRYAADAGLRPPGAYTFTAEAVRGGTRLGDDRGTFGVGRTAAEFREPGADPALMRLVALRSGGRTVPLDSLGAFVASLRESGALADRPLVRRDAAPLLGLPWLLALAVALLTAEWVLRKRAGMV